MTDHFADPNVPAHVRGQHAAQLARDAADNPVADYEFTWADVWAPILEDDEGNVDFDQLKRELHDYWGMMAEVSKVYYHITDGLLSKPHTAAVHIISAHDEAINERDERVGKLADALKAVLDFAANHYSTLGGHDHDCWAQASALFGDTRALLRHLDD